MTFSIYDASIPVYQQGLATLETLLGKLESHCQEKGVDAATLLGASLTPDMFNFTRQVLIACDHAKGGACRLAGAELPRFEDTEKTVEELRARIRKTLDVVNSVKREQFEGAEGRDIQLVFPWATYDFKGSRFLTYWSLPNFFFHVTTAYDILRQQGVNIGKADFLGH